MRPLIRLALGRTDPHRRLITARLTAAGADVVLADVKPGYLAAPEHDVVAVARAGSSGSAKRMADAALLPTICAWVGNRYASNRGPVMAPPGLCSYTLT